MKTLTVYFLLAGILALGNSCSHSSTVPIKKIDTESENRMVEKVIHDAICWAMTKDTVTLFNTFVPDSTLFIELVL